MEGFSACVIKEVSTQMAATGKNSSSGSAMVNEMEDITFATWKKSMVTMFDNLHNPFVRARSISIVPDQQRTSKEEAYMPKVVSIGPIHRGTRRGLLYMEEIKWLCMMSLLNRTPNAVENLDMCSNAIYHLDEVVRSCYVNDIKFNRYDLAKIMLLDGCFLLELLISGSEDLDKELSCSSRPGPGAKVGKNEDVLSDLTVLENQIPFLIVTELATLLFPHVFAVKDGKKKIKEPLLSLLGYSPPKNENYDDVSAHVLELAHSFITKKVPEHANPSKGSTHLSTNVHNREIEEKVEERQQIEGEDEIVEGRQDQKRNARDAEKVKEDRESKHFAINVDKKEINKESNVVGKSNEVNGKSHKKIYQQPKLKRCATRLLAAGVEIVGKNTKCSEFGFDCDIGFSESNLVIPCLYITKTTEVKWRNFIAWEQVRNDRAKYIGNETGVCCKFNWYALFFHGLICCEHDIQLLKVKKVIVLNDDQHDSKKKGKMNDEELLDFFNKITAGVQDYQIDEDSSFSQLFHKLNSYSPTVAYLTEKRIIIWHYFRRFLTDTWYICRNLYAILIRDHIPTVWKLVALLYATALLGLTIAQTIFSARN